jgi:poly-gamma-glutamate synthesis protein (capsule biosynthesis protein)
MRAWTVYEQIEHDQPGTPCRIHTVPHQGDLKAMIQDIRDARSQADVVIVSMHWGIHFVPAVIAEYQREIGHTAIDSGADVIIGHHAHILKGIEVYKGKVIFYSLANFALEEPRVFAEGSLDGPGHKELKDLYASPKSGPDLLSPDTRKTLIAKCTLGTRAIKKVSVLPTVINNESQPEVLISTDQRFGEVVKYVEDISKNQGLDARLVIEGDEVVIHQP